MSLILFLCGDVMTGRGIDQVFPHSGEAQLREPYVKDAREYVKLAEMRNGPISRPVDFRYIWGDSLAELDRVQPDFRIINLETSVTVSHGFSPHKEIHYRMHPRNLACLTAAGVDCAVLANNHVLDFGYEGLAETLKTLDSTSITTAGAGDNIERACSPAVLERNGKRVLVYACAHGSSGASPEWAADREKAGINFLPDLSGETVSKIRNDITSRRRHGDKVVLSIHWGDNWGYEVTEAHRQFAHALIDAGIIDVIHGHSSHHARAIELYQGKPILYGCGDFIDDYEGISGYEAFRPDLKLMYFLHLNPADGTLLSMQMVTMVVKRFSLQKAGETDAQWLCGLLNREGASLSSKFEMTSRNTLELVR